jgi:hypothetical protein
MDKKDITINNNKFSVGIIEDIDDIWNYKHTIYFINFYT